MFSRNLFAYGAVKNVEAGLSADERWMREALEEARKAAEIGEVPIVSVDRLYGGKSTFRLTSWTVEYLRWFFWGWRELRRSPTRMRRSDVQVKLPAAFVES